MVLKKEEIIERIKGYVGEDTSDEAISFIEDVTETIEDYDTKLSVAQNNENEIRKKYVDRFFSENAKETIEEKEETEEIQEKPKTFEDLFKEG